MELTVNGHKVDTHLLCDKFTPFYNSGQRIIVKTPWGDTIRGYVGKTTGWIPSYLLLNNTRSLGSSELLNDEYEIIGTVDKYRF